MSTTKNERIEVRTDNLQGIAPLYRKSVSDCSPWRAYVELDCGAARIEADYYPRDNSTPGSVWHGLTRQYAIDPTIQRQSLIDLMKSDDLQSLAWRVLAGYSSEINDQSSLVGSLTDEAREASDELSDLVRDWATDQRCCRVEEAIEILHATPNPRRVETSTCRISYEHDLTRETSDAELREWAVSLEAECEAQDCIVDGDLYGELVEMRGELADDDADDDTTNIRETKVAIRTRDGGTVTAHLHRDGTVEISENGRAAGTGRWQTPGSTIRDCAARLGAGDGSETEALYQSLEEAIVDAIEE